MAPVHSRHEPGAPAVAGRTEIAIESLGIAPRTAPRAGECARSEVADRGCRLRTIDERRSALQANDTLKPSACLQEASWLIALRAKERIRAPLPSRPDRLQLNVGR